MTAIILDVAAAVPTNRNRQPWPLEELRLSLCEVKEAVVRRVQAARNWKQHLDVDRHPVPELELLFVHHVPEFDIPPREVIEPKSPARREDSSTLLYPRLAPVQVFLFLQRVIYSSAVILVEVERRISKNDVKRIVLDLSEQFEAVALKQLAMA